MSPRARLLFSFLVSAAVCAAVYADVVFGGRTFLPAGRTPAAYASRPDQHSPFDRAEWDPGFVAWEVLPWAHVERRALREGSLPLWDRGNGLGHPLLGSGQTALFHPLHWLALVDPSKPALWDAVFLLARILCAAGSVLLLFEFGAPPAIAALGAPIGALNGVFIIFATRSDVQVYAAMPWILLALLRLRKRPGPLPALGLAVSIALCFFAAHPEPAFVVLSTCAACALLLLLRAEERRLHYLCWAAIGATCAILLSAPYWLPLLDLIPVSWSLHPAQAGFQPVPAKVALKWLLPTIFSQGGVRQLWAGDVATGYLGPACSVLAICALISAIRRETWRNALWVWPALFLALAIHGLPGTQWLGRLPLIDRMPFADYYQFPALFLFAVMGALGLRFIWPALAGVALVAVIAFAVTHAPLKVGYALACAMAFGLVAWRAPALLVIGCALDLAAFRSPLSKRADPLATGPYVQWLQERARVDPPFRVMGLRWALAPNSAAAFGLEDLRLCEALFPPQVARAVETIQPRDGWEWMPDPESGFDVNNAFLDAAGVRYLVTQGTPPFRIQSQPVRSFLDARLPLVESRMDPNGTPSLLLWRNRPATARVHVPEPGVLVGAVERVRPNEIPRWTVSVDGEQVATGDEGALRADLGRFAGRDVNLTLAASEYAKFAALRWNGEPPEDLLHGLRVAYRDTLVPDLLVLERPRFSPRAVVLGDAGARASVSYSANAVTIEAESQRGGTLVLHDAWAPGWEATLNGKPAPLFLVEPAFRGVAIGAGRQSIVMRYSPRAWTTAWMLGALGLAGALLLAAVAARRPHLGSMDDKKRNEGEGSKTADKKYRDAATEFAKRTDTLQTGLQAERDVEARKPEFDKAEEIGKSKSKGELPNDVSGSDFDKR